MRLVVLLFWIALVGPAQASPAPRSIMQDDQTLLRSGDAARERALDDMAALGVDAVRVLVVWRDVDDGVLANLDAAIGGARARGMDVLLTPTGPGPGAGPRRFDPRRFGAFVARLGARYPQQRHWAIWNEPNNPRWLTPQFGPGGRMLAPAQYRRLFVAARDALRRTGHRSDELLLGETAPLGKVRGPLATRPIMPGRFLRALLEHGTLGATGLSHHAYTRGGTRPPRFPALKDELSVASLGALVKLARGLPVHLTEGGWQTSPPDPLFGVPLARQGQYLNEAEWIVRGQPRIRSFPQYLLFDEARDSAFQSGLRFFDGRPKPALAAYRLPIWVVRKGARVTVWGRARAATSGTVEVQRRTRAGWRTLARSRADDDVLVRLRAPHGRWRLKLGPLVSRTAVEARR